jgi:pyruvate dehydrogenase E2 component (dihydrolipoamide acetyltransferase)
VSVDVVVPEVGEIGMQVTFVRWLVDEGAMVKAGEPLFELDTEKALMEVEAAEDGQISGFRVHHGQLVEPRQIVAALRQPGDAEAAPLAGSADAWSPEATPPAAGRVAATPRARSVAIEQGVDLASIAGTGPEGSITEQDVRAAAPGAQQPPNADRSQRTRRVVAARTAAAWHSVPHFSLHLMAEVEAALGLGRPMPVIARAAVQALERHAELNLAWDGDDLVPREGVDLGLLVAAPTGLLLPAVRGAERLSLAELDVALTAAADRAKEGKLNADDSGAHSLTISNLGMYAVDGFTGIIPAPVLLLLAVGRVRTAPIWTDGEWRPRKVVDLTLSVDHRALDGSDGARYLTTLEEILRSEDLA